MSERSRRQSGEGLEHWVVDGLEDTPRGRVARLELPDGQTRDLPLSALPADLREGDILGVQDGPDGVKAVRLPELTAQRQTQRQAELDDLNGSTPPQQEIDL